MPTVRPRQPRNAVARNPGGFAALVIVDQEPLRREAAGECAGAMSRLERARADWHRFEQKDKPAFVRWRAREFGALLSTAREVEVQIREHQALIHEVEMEMRREIQDPHSAYQRVMFRREHPAAAVEENDDVHETSSGVARKMTEFEKEALFQEWVQKSLGTNPDKMDDEAYSTTFEAFKLHMFRTPSPGPPQPQNTFRARSAERVAPEVEVEEPLAPVDARVKELYRTLVRRLHPDRRADGTVAVSALWHEVQEAYAAQDIARMELLLAVSDIGANAVGNETTLAQMRAVAMELQRAVRALEMSLIEAQREEAWDFASQGPRGDLRLRVERELKSELANRTARLDLLRRTIASWSENRIEQRCMGPQRRFA